MINNHSALNCVCKGKRASQDVFEWFEEEHGIVPTDPTEELDTIVAECQKELPPMGAEMAPAPLAPVPLPAPPTGSGAPAVTTS